MAPKYKRILLKIIRRSLMGDKSFGFDNGVIAQYARISESIGGAGCYRWPSSLRRHIYRGMNEAETGIERATGTIWLLATVITGMAMQAGLEKIGVYNPVAKRHQEWNR